MCFPLWHPKSAKWAGMQQIATKASPPQQFGNQMPELLNMSLLKPSGSHLVTKCQNWSNWAFWDHLGAIWPPGARIAPNELSQAIWEPFGHQVPEVLKMSLLRPSGSHLAARCQNCSKWAFWSHLWAIWSPGARIAQNKPSEAIWEPFGYQRSAKRAGAPYIATKCAFQYAILYQQSEREYRI